jgi:hypothetical protein
MEGCCPKINKKEKKLVTLKSHNSVHIFHYLHRLRSSFYVMYIGSNLCRNGELTRL